MGATHTLLLLLITCGSCVTFLGPYSKRFWVVFKRDIAVPTHGEGARHPAAGPRARHAVRGVTSLESSDERARDCRHLSEIAGPHSAA